MVIKHHILVFGGTGACGQLFTRTALQVGHKLTLYVRTPSKLSADIVENDNVNVIEGHLDDEEGLQKAADCGADILVCLAGPTLGWREGTPVTNGLKKFYPLLLKANPHIRILVLSTASYSVPQDTWSIKWFFGIQCFIRVIGGDSYPEINGISQTTAALGDDVEWTMFRVPLMSGTKLSDAQQAAIKTLPDGEVDNKDEASVNDVNSRISTAFVGDKHGKDWLHLDRGRLVLWILGEIEERRWIRLCPTLANA